MTEQRIKEGPPIWVESVYSPQEYREAAKKFPNTFPKGGVAISYDPSIHKGGKWRDGMRSLTAEEISAFNRGIDDLRKLLLTKKFQKRPDYGPDNEARP